ncbi:hypothetical protein [Maribacter sp. 1_2014MBL_MicDiv]|uniref:hypothetical protein n=1 Tax=Maribacter sp. 1_2014MBL_MicDiv TaxID=1644130 RepID=UPI0008F4BD0F|nr:hypothetical protein [Maribacter sp. 1_2014MBL_MicDiv]APA65646.1 hypothetical protein YQ22_15790 [Maribacter sp. 1_2014MBL_MicDiv]
MKTTHKLKKYIANLETALATIETVEKEVKTALRANYKNKVLGKKEFRVKTRYSFNQLSMMLYFKVDGKAVIKNAFVFYSPTIVEDAIATIDKQLNQ